MNARTLNSPHGRDAHRMMRFFPAWLWHLFLERSLVAFLCGGGHCWKMAKSVHPAVSIWRLCCIAAFTISWCLMNFYGQAYLVVPFVLIFQKQISSRTDFPHSFRCCYFFRDESFLKTTCLALSCLCLATRWHSFHKIFFVTRRLPCWFGLCCLLSCDSLLEMTRPACLYRPFTKEKSLYLRWLSSLFPTQFAGSPFTFFFV